MNARNHDRTEYLVRDPAEWQGAGFVYAKVTEAYEHWIEDRDCDVFEFNPVEGYCRRLNDDFEDWAEEDEAETRSTIRHERSYSAGRA